MGRCGRRVGIVAKSFVGLLQHHQRGLGLCAGQAAVSSDCWLGGGGFRRAEQLQRVLCPRGADVCHAGGGGRRQYVAVCRLAARAASDWRGHRLGPAQWTRPLYPPGLQSGHLGAGGADFALAAESAMGLAAAAGLCLRRPHDHDFIFALAADGDFTGFCPAESSGGRLSARGFARLDGLAGLWQRL